MKRFISILMMIALCTVTFCTASADEREIDSPFFQNAAWTPKDVDLSGVREENGRLVGVVNLPKTNQYGAPAGEIFVDCQIPVNFKTEQQVRLHVAHKEISAQNLLGALNAMGQNPAGGEFGGYNNVNQTAVCYACEPNLDGGFFWQQLANASMSADIAYEQEYAQAKDVARSFIGILGGTVCESVYHANRRDAAHNNRYSVTSTSGELKWSQERNEFFDASEAKYGRTERNLTMVSGLYELYGLPVMDQYYWKDDGDWMGASSAFGAAIRDDGAIRYVQIDGLPQVVSAERIELPTFTWRELLRQSVAYLCVSNATPIDVLQEDGIRYASYAVITDLKPCWVGTTNDTLVPGWYCVTEERVKNDDSIVFIWAQYGDMEALMTLGA